MSDQHLVDGTLTLAAALCDADGYAINDDNIAETIEPACAAIKAVIVLIAKERPDLATGLGEFGAAWAKAVPEPRLLAQALRVRAQGAA